VSQNETYDPKERTSRSVHEFNKGLDKVLVGPTAKGYGTIIPKVLRRTVSNAAGYLGLPIQAVNNVLQVDPKGLGQTVLRFAVNSLTFGLGDLATEAGIPDNNADFGQTLHVWGVPQGVYHEMPVLGPSTTRDTVGFLIDSTINPINFLIPNEPLVGPSFYVLDRLSDRDQYSEVIEDTLYNSDDSHATAKSLYLQNRNFHLNSGVDEDSLEDPFAEF
jgi:phospholipid-binding lipoprotein MlaA